MDIQFGPDSNGNKYISVHYHQKGAQNRQNKTRWLIPPKEEFEVFKRADEYKDCKTQLLHRWISGKFLFSFKDNCKTIIGEDKCVLAKFIPDVNDSTLWHGYPIKGELIETELLHYWYDQNLISGAIRTKINQRKL